MALRVWLPLNGNLENKGLSNVQFSTFGTPIIQSGKFGNGYYFDGNGDYFQTENTDVGNFTSNFTMCI